MEPLSKTQKSKLFSDRVSDNPSAQKIRNKKIRKKKEKKTKQKKGEGKKNPLAQQRSVGSERRGSLD